MLAEYALVKVRREKLEEMAQQGHNTASLALRMTEKLDTYLSAAQMGITTSSVLLGLFAGPFFVDVLKSYGVQDTIIAWVISFIVVVFMHVVFGELVPRAAALNKVEKTVLLIAYPMIFFHYLLYPLVLAFNKVSRGVLKILGINKAPQEDLSRSEEELRRIVSASEEVGQLDHVESRMIDNVFDFADRVTREIMVPRQDMVCLFTDDSLSDNLAAVRSSRHTRYPLCDEDKDHVIGVVHIRDLIDLDPKAKSFDFTTVMRPMTVVPEAMSTVKVLQLMQKEHIQMALVADEYGGTAGLITMEDLVEEIVGEIQDEHEAEEPDDIEKISDTVYEFDGMVLLDEITEILPVEFDDPEEDTIGGYVFGVLGRKPEVGDVVEIPGCKFSVLAAEGFRVMRVKAVLTSKPKVEDDGDDQ